AHEGPRESLCPGLRYDLGSLGRVTSPEGDVRLAGHDLVGKVAVVVLAGVDGVEADQCPGVPGIESVPHDAGEAGSIGRGVVGDIDLGALDDLLCHVRGGAPLGEVVADRPEPRLETALGERR